MIAITALPISAALLLKQIYWWSWKSTIIFFFVAQQCLRFAMHMLLSCSNWPIKLLQTMPLLILLVVRCSSGECEYCIGFWTSSIHFDWFSGSYLKRRGGEKLMQLCAVCTEQLKTSKYVDGRGPKDLEKNFHCIRAVSQQVSLKLNGWIAGLNGLDWDVGRDGRSGTLSLILTQSAFMSLLFPFKLGKWQLK